LHKPTETEFKETLDKKGIDTDFLEQRVQKLAVKNKRRALSVTRLAEEMEEEELEGQMADEVEERGRRI
jgi:hypothetical protein